MIPVKIDEIAEQNLQSLIDTGMAEGRTIDFKRDLPGRDNAARHEFLSDVCAFANLTGGDLVFGIEENGEGVAQAIVAQAANPDDECLRLQDMVLNGIEPRLSGVHAHAVMLHGGGSVFVVRVPQSWMPPHRVKTNNHFYVREGNRKRQLDVPEIRMIAIQGESLRERMRNFRGDRIGKVIGGETPVPLFDGAIGILHVVPLGTVLHGIEVDVLPYTRERRLPVVSAGMGGNWRLNIDGVLHSRNVTPQGCGAYTQLFRNGCVEAVRVFTTQLDDGRYNMASRAYEEELIAFLNGLKPELEYVGAGAPLVLMYSLIHANKAALGLNPVERFGLDDTQGKFDRAVLLLPDVVLEDLATPSHQLLKAMFDLVWNAAGIQRSWNYDEQGNWIAGR
jgi:hypothetical protein